MKFVVIAILVIGLGGLFTSGKSVGGLNCFCPRLPKGCSPYTPPGECCPRCSGCEPTGEISYDDNGNLLSWKPSPCEFCTCVNGRPRCGIQDCAAPFCENYVTVKGRCCPVCPPGDCNPTGDIFYENNILTWKPDPCTYCRCVDGHPLCAVQGCAPPYCENYVAVKGRCCPVCPPGDCNPTGDIFYDNGILSWRPDPCTYCSCVDGHPLCAVQSCAAPSCPNYVIPEGECCPICPNNLPYYITKKWQLTEWRTDSLTSLIVVCAYYQSLQLSECILPHT